MIKLSDRFATPIEYARFSREELVARINARKSELNAVILGHNYQRLEIQAVSDYLGDSLGLSQEAARTKADVIVFCGVHFMAETAKILSPEKLVLMPDLRAGCPMADFVTAQSLQKLKALQPEAAVVTYVNSTAAVKAESDICCTSANAVKVVDSFPHDRTILFVPDKNLAQYAASQTGRPIRNSAEFLKPGAIQAVEPGTIIAWDGYCYVHDDLVLQELDDARQKHPRAKVVIHPEARADLLSRADFVVSTSGMGEIAEKFDELIIGTERGLIDRLQQRFPNKTIVPLSRAAVCGNMKVNTLSKLAWCLDNQKHELVLPEDVRLRARVALDRMLELSKGWNTSPTPEAEQLEQQGLVRSGCGCA
jgi:quinolinate synthase